MARKKTTVYMDEDLLRSARVLAERTDRSEYDIFEDAVRRYLGLHLLESLAAAVGLQPNCWSRGSMAASS